MSYQSSRSKNYFSEDTIVAPATAVGGAVGMIRLSGPDSLPILEKMIVGEFLEKRNPGKLGFTRLCKKDGKKLDESLCVYFRGPKSFTGEDVVEIQYHGSTYLTSQLMAELVDRGARLALPGEFSFRAVRNGKRNLFQAEALKDLFEATNSRAADIALEKMSGNFAQYWNEIRDQLKDVAAIGEVGIDFSDQNIDITSLAELKKDTSEVVLKLERLSASYQQGSLVQNGIRLALIGVPNAGKSSLFNSILGQDRSIVTEVPGTTRDVVHEQITLTGSRTSLTYRVEDTAGIRNSEDPVEKIGIEKSRNAFNQAQVCFWIIDLSESVNDQLMEFDRIKQGSVDRDSVQFVVFNKLDLLSDAERETITQKYKELPNSYWVSSTQNTGVPELIRDLVDMSELKWLGTSEEEPILTRLDHQKAINSSIENLNRAVESEDLEFLAADVRHGLNALSPVIGDTVPDDILGKIFSEFCIGK